MFALYASASAQSDVSSVMRLVVNETQAPRKLAFVHEEIHVRPGALALAYPKWIPGEHGPTGPIQQFAVLQIHSENALLPWTRDPEEINTIRVNIPAGTKLIKVDFDALVVNTISDHQLLLAWNTALLYPLGIDKTKLMIEPSIVLPANWKNASSLTVKSQAGSRTDFAPVSLERLSDSPVLAGEYLRVVQLNSNWPAELDITGDSPAAVDKADDAHAFDSTEIEFVQPCREPGTADKAWLPPEVRVALAGASAAACPAAHRVVRLAGVSRLRESSPAIGCDGAYSKHPGRHRGSPNCDTALSADSSPGEIFNHGQITPCQLAQRAYAGFAMIDGLEIMQA